MKYFFNLFILESQSKWGRGRERRRERIPSGFCTASTEPDVGLELSNHEIMTWAEMKSWTLNQWATQSPREEIFLFFIFLESLGASVCRWGKGRGRERIPSRLHAWCGPHPGAGVHNREIWDHDLSQNQDWTLTSWTTRVPWWDSCW